MLPATDEIIRQSLQLQRQGRHARDEELLRGALALRSDDADLALALATALSHRAVASQDARDESRAWALRAVDLAATEPHILFRAASHLFFLGDTDTSRELLRGVHKYANDSFVFAADALHLAGQLALLRGDVAQAERGLRGAFEQAPEVPGHGLHLAEFYAEQGRYLEARRVVSKAAALSPGDDDLRGLQERLPT